MTDPSEPPTRGLDDLSDACAPLLGTLERRKPVSDRGLQRTRRPRRTATGQVPQLRPRALTHGALRTCLRTGCDRAHAHSLRTCRPTSISLRSISPKRRHQWLLNAHGAGPRPSETGPQSVPDRGPAASRRKSAAATRRPGSGRTARPSMPTTSASSAKERSASRYSAGSEHGALRCHQNPIAEHADRWLDIRFVESADTGRSQAAHRVARDTASHFEIERVVYAETQNLTAVPRRLLKKRITSLQAQQPQLEDAVDFLFRGY